MTDMEMDLVIANAEIMTLRDTVRKYEDTIATQRIHIAALQTIIDDLRKQLGGGSGG